MKTVTSGFKTALKTFGKQINAEITYGTVTLTASDINSIDINSNGSLFKCCMQGVEIDSNKRILVGTAINVKFGVYVTSAYEMLDYGDYIVKSCEYNADTKSYIIIAYDSILKSMIPYDLVFTYSASTTINDLLTAICTRLGYTLSTSTYANKTSIITEDVYAKSEYTFRDVLDDIAGVVGGIITTVGDNLYIKYPTETNEIIDEYLLKDTNITMGKHYGPINSLVFSRNLGTDETSLQNADSIENYGLTELKISENLLINGVDRDNFIDELYAQILGLDFYLCNYDSSGILYLELGDIYTIKIADGLFPSTTLYPNTTLFPKKTHYKTILLQDNIKINQGLTENIYTEAPKINVETYEKTAEYDKKLKTLTLKADQINLEGYTTINGGFSVDLLGNATMNDATIYGDIYLPNTTTQVVGSLGILTNLGYSGLFNQLGYIVDTYSGASLMKGTVNLDVYIPTDFTVVSAIITVQAYKTNNILILPSTGIDVTDEYGKITNIKLYKVTVSGEFVYSDYGYWNYGVQPTTVEIAGAFGASGYTNATTGTVLFYSGDIGSSLVEGMNQLVIKTGDADLTPYNDANVTIAAQKSQTAFATITVLGYQK